VTFRCSNLPFSGARACLLAAGLVAVALAPAVRAAEAASDEPPALGEKTSEALTKLQAMIDAKDWDGALATLNAALAVAGPDSYDRALIMDTSAKLYFQKDDTAKAIAAWEEALRLADAHPNYMKLKERLELILSLAQTHSQLAQNTKDPMAARADFAKAADYIRRWLAITPKPTFDAENFYALVLYSQATANDKKIDQDLLRQARLAAEKALHLQIKPKESLLVVVNAIYQQSNDLLSSARYLELLVQLNPAKESYWQQLWAVYMNLAAGEDKDESKAREYYALAIDTMERAQAFGKMKTKKDNYNMATMYYSAGQYGKTTELLSAGLHDGSIDPTIKNWELLSYSYQQVNEPLKAIEALKDAEKVPDLANDGNLDFEIGNIYAQLEKSADAYQSYLAAVTKGHLEKPYTAYQYLAYQAYEEEKFKEALDAVNHAATYPQGQGSSQLENLRKLIMQSLKLQENAPPPATPTASST